MSNHTTVAFIGTGLMGAPMAMRLLSAGYPLTVWNRTPDKTRELSARGARVAKTPADAVEGAEVVIAMLADGAAVTHVLFDRGIAHAMTSNAMVVDMSSIPPASARENGHRLARRGIPYLDAPVSGGTRGAADGTLAIMVGGDLNAYEAARPVLTILGRPTLIGPSGSGQLTKLANQMIVALTIGAVAEALLLAAAGGADPAKVKEALCGGFADSAILKQHGQRMIDRSWIPGGAFKTQVKDLRTVLEVAKDLKLDLPLVGEVARVFESGLCAGLGNHDHSALLLEIERRNAGTRVGRLPDRSPGAS
jgi:2-hydroxy-3-oxopropionate reductase